MTRVLRSFKTIVESRMPRAFALVCPLFDERAARNPLSEARLLPLLVAEGDTACDIGANRGLFTYWLLKRGVKVLTFEPNPKLVRILRLRFGKQIAKGDVRIFETALSDEAGEAVLHIPQDLSPLATIDGNLAAEIGGRMMSVRVPLARLDGCVTGDVSFIKLDVEGHEAKVLEGATGVLQASRPTLLIEAEERHRPGAVAAVRAILEPFGYQGFFLAGAGAHPLSEFDPAIHQADDGLLDDHSRVKKGGIYVNNFFFAARPQIIERLGAWRA